uniref:hypothetical protein n=1 Tax=Thaumasiovibrio occultus TaxID=1891184 RepID=UPI000B361B30|nr:hypothetical protein [Thaumasiovibrio occultus]
MNLSHKLFIAMTLPIALSGCVSTDKTAASCFSDQFYQSGKTYHYTDSITSPYFDEVEDGGRVTLQVAEQGEDEIVVSVSQFLPSGGERHYDSTYHLDTDNGQFGLISNHNAVYEQFYDELWLLADLNAQVGESTSHHLTRRKVMKETGAVESQSVESTVTFKEISTQEWPLGEFEACVFQTKVEDVVSTEWYRRSDGLLLQSEIVMSDMKFHHVLTAIEPLENMQ